MSNPRTKKLLCGMLLMALVAAVSVGAGLKGTEVKTAEAAVEQNTEQSEAVMEATFSSSTEETESKIKTEEELKAVEEAVIAKAKEIAKAEAELKAVEEAAYAAEEAAKAEAIAKAAEEVAKAEAERKAAEEAAKEVVKAEEAKMGNEKTNKETDKDTGKDEHDKKGPNFTDTIEMRWPDFNEKLGTLSSDDLGISGLKLYWSDDQAICDATNSACIVTLATLPGDMTDDVLLGDHNYQTGRLFANAQVGDRIYLSLSYGDFVYECIGQEYGTVENGGADLITDGGKSLTFNKPDKKKRKGDIYMFTCYPLNAKYTDRRLLIKFKLVEGVEVNIID